MSRRRNVDQGDWARMDWASVETEFGRDRMARVVDRVPVGGRHLDLGTGRGDGTVQLLGRTDCFGLEYGLTSLLDAVSKGCRVVQADGRRLPFADAAFDSATCLDVLEHVPRPQEMLDELGRVLRPGGLLVLQTPNREMFKERMLRLARSLGYPQRQPYDVPLPRAEIVERIAAAGFELEREERVPCWDPRAWIRVFSFSRLFLCRQPG